jgi:hypothetical protein
VFSFLADMRKRDLNPHLEHSQSTPMIRISYRPEELYYDWLKANKRLALMEFEVERLLGIRLE